MLGKLIAFLERSLSSRAAIAYYVGKKIEDVGPILPSRRLVYATLLCFLALLALSISLILCIVLLGEAPPGLISAIASLAGTIVGIYVGRRW